jgi:hypothetical protein
MSDHDFDLITELINGHLSPDERRAALSRVAADPELQSEYETQLAVSSLLRRTSPPTMTAAERSELRTALRQQLNLEAAPVPAAVAPSRWQRWWAPVAGLAAAAAVIIGVVIVLPDGDSGDSLEFAAAEVETTIQASRNDATDAADAGGSSGSSDGADEGLPTTTAAALEELASPATAEDTTTESAEDATDGSVEAAGESSPDALPYLPEVDLNELSLAHGEGPEEFEDELRKSSSASEPVTTSDGSACLDGIGDAESETSFAIVATGTIGDVEVVVIVATPLSGDPYFIALDAGTCGELASTRP